MKEGNKSTPNQNISLGGNGIPNWQTALKNPIIPEYLKLQLLQSIGQSIDGPSAQ